MFTMDTEDQELLLQDDTADEDELRNSGKLIIKHVYFNYHRIREMSFLIADDTQRFLEPAVSCAILATVVWV